MILCWVVELDMGGAVAAASPFLIAIFEFDDYFLFINPEF